MIALHELADLTLFPALAKPTLDAEQNSGVDDDGDAPADKRPVKPPVVPVGQEVEHEQPCVDREVGDQMTDESLDILDPLLRPLIARSITVIGVHGALLAAGRPA